MFGYGVYSCPDNVTVSENPFNVPNRQTTGITLHKGVDNPLSFIVMNADGKYMKLGDNEALVVNLYDATRERLIYQTTLVAVAPTTDSEAGLARPTFSNSTKVYYSGSIPAGVIQDLVTGYNYRYSVVKMVLNPPRTPMVTPLYTDLTKRVDGFVEIVDSVVPAFTPSYEISLKADASFVGQRWNMAKTIVVGVPDIDNYSMFSSSAVPAGAQFGELDGTSTIAIYLKDFKGRIQLQGNLSNDAPVDSEDYKWFDIELDAQPYLEYGMTPDSELGNGIKAFNIRGNYMWVRVRLLAPKIITVNPITLQNIVKYNIFDNVPKILYRK